jgi:DNA-binding transcriptional LysR family regulator
VRLSLKSLQLFSAIVEQKSITKAARASNIALAAASRRLTLLEQEAGIRLINRTSGGVELTAAGASTLFHVRRILQQIEDLQAQLADYGKGVRGVISVHVNTSALLQYVPKDLGTFAALHPDIKVSLQERWSSEIVEAVRAGTADIGIVLSQKAAEAKRPLRLRVQVKSFEGVCRMVQAGLGVGILPQGAVKEMVKGMSLKLVPLSDRWADRKMYICVRDPKDLSQVAWQLVEHLREKASVV